MISKIHSLRAHLLIRVLLIKERKIKIYFVHIGQDKKHILFLKIAIVLLILNKIKILILLKTKNKISTFINRKNIKRKRELKLISNSKREYSM